MNEMLRKTEAVGAELGMSLLEVLSIVNEIVMMEVDPIVPTGPRFVFPILRDPMIHCDDLLWINPQVPHPHQLCDLFLARREVQRDALRCKAILENPNVTVDDILRVRWNTLGWARFWAVRDPDPEWRSKWQGVVEILVQEIEHTAAKAQAVVKTEK